MAMQISIIGSRTKKKYKRTLDQSLDRFNTAVWTQDFKPKSPNSIRLYSSIIRIPPTIMKPTNYFVMANDGLIDSISLKLT